MTKRGAHNIRRSRGSNVLTFDSGSNTVSQYLTLMLWTQRYPPRLAILFHSIPFHCAPFHSRPFLYSIIFHSIPFHSIFSDRARVRWAGYLSAGGFEKRVFPPAADAPGETEMSLRYQTVPTDRAAPFVAQNPPTLLLTSS